MTSSGAAIHPSSSEMGRHEILTALTLRLVEKRRQPVESDYYRSTALAQRFYHFSQQLLFQLGK